MRRRRNGIPATVNSTLIVGMALTLCCAGVTATALLTGFKEGSWGIDLTIMGLTIYDGFQEHLLS